MDNQDDANSPTLTRRRLLGSAAGLAAASAAALMPPNVRRALAQAPTSKASLRDIKHVVLLMQENRSFDHYFGTMAGVRGFADPQRAEAAKWAIGLLPARSGQPRRLPAAVPLGYPHDQRAEDPFHQPRLGGAARVVERREDGQLAAGPPQSRRGEGPLRHGLSHAVRHSLSVRARRGLHDLRRLSLLGHGPDLAEPDVLDDRHDRPGGQRRRPVDRETSWSPAAFAGPPTPSVCRTSGRQLESLPAAGQLRLQHAGILQGVPRSRPETRTCTTAG